MATYFPDARFFNENGHLYPYDLRYDPDNRAHLDLLTDGTVRFRVITEARISSGFLVLSDGTGVEMHHVVRGPRVNIWQASITRPAGPMQYTFAFRTTTGRAVHLVPAGVSNAVERLDRWTLDPDRLTPFEVPDWMRGAVMYQIFPERFANGDPSLDPEGVDPWGAPPRWLNHQGGDLIGITDKADYLADLGVDVVYLNPIFSSPSTHKYDAVDFYRVDAHFGGNEALRRLVDKLHNRDIRLILDVSFNHCHPTFFAFADLIANGAASPYKDWFVVREFPVAITVRPRQMARSGWKDPDAYLGHLRALSESASLPLREADNDGPPMELNYEA